MLHHEEASSCGCDTAKSLDVDCKCIGYSDCPQTIDAIPLKSTRRLCFDFYRADCEDCHGCEERFYEHIRFVDFKKVNPPCIEGDEGFISISQTYMNPDNGRFSFTVDTNDQSLKSGERFYIEAWARLPNTEERSIKVYLSVK